MNLFSVGLSVVVGLFAAGVVFLFEVGRIYSGAGITPGMISLAVGVMAMVALGVLWLMNKLSPEGFPEGGKGRPMIWLLGIGATLAVLWFVFLCMILMGIGSLIIPLLMALLGIPDLIWKDVSGRKSTAAIPIAGLGLFVIGLLTLSITPLSLDSFRIPNPDVVKIDLAYANLYREGLRGWSCDETCSLIGDLQEKILKKSGRNNPNLKALQSLKFRSGFQPGKGHQLNCDATGFQPTTDPVFNYAVSQLIKKVKSESIIAYKNWAAYTLVALMPPRGVKEEKDASGYKVSGFMGGDEGTVVLDNQYKVLQWIDRPSSGLTLVSVPELQETSKGYLLQSLIETVSLANGSKPSITMTIHYQEVQGFQFPDEIDEKRVDAATPKSNYEIKFHFTNYQLVLADKS